MVDRLSLYHSLPYTLRVVVASLHGYRLRSMRYTKITEQLAAQALERDHWTSERWTAWQQERLAQMLWHASRNVPFYRNYWETRRRHGDHRSVESLEHWPVLSKETLRAQPKIFLADHTDLRLQVEEHTSGTSGKPLTLWISKEAVRQWYGLFEARSRNWYGLSRFDRWGILGGQLVAPYRQSKPPYWVWNAGMRQLYLSSYHLAPLNISAYMDAIQEHKLVYLLGYASSLYSLAQLALEQGINAPALKAIISNAEPLYLHQRETISRAFQCSVYDTYGLSEGVSAASECLRGHLHLWPEAGVLEVLDEENDHPVPGEDVGRLVGTGLLNLTMPLIRYEVGDRGYLSSRTSCGCKRSLPILGGIEGRKDDVIVTPDGRRIGRLDPVFKEDLPIREAQIIQEDTNRIVVFYVPSPDCSSTHLRQLVKRLHERLGDMEIKLKAVDNIPRSANGKFKAVISRIV